MSAPPRTVARSTRRSPAARRRAGQKPAHVIARGLPLEDGVVAPSGIDPVVLERASRVIRVIGHPMRLRLLELLEGRERHVTDLVNASGISQALVSQQLRILRAEGVVGDRRVGPRVYYRITEPKVSKILDCIRTCDMPDLAGTTTEA